MTALECTEALRKRVEEILKDISIECGGGNKKTPQVISGFLPPKNSSDVPDFPFVAVRLQKLQESKDKAIAEIELVIGVKEEQEDEETLKVLGWMRNAEIMERIRIGLLISPELDDRFDLQLPLEYELEKEPAYPYWMGWMSTKWSIPKIIREENLDE